MKACALPVLFVLVASAPGLAAAQQEIWFGTAPFCAASPADCTNASMDYVRSDPSGDGSKCVSGTKVLCRKRAQTQGRSGPLASQWVGKAPFCQGRAEDCALMDFDYVRSDASGDGSRCVSGQKVLCQARNTPCDPRAFLPEHPPEETRVEQAWGIITDAMKNAGIGGSWQHLGTTSITGCILQIGKNDRTLGDNWRTLDVRVLTVCGRPVTDTRYIRIEVLPGTRAYETAIRASYNDIIWTGGEFGYDWPHRVPEGGSPLREIRPADQFKITGKQSYRCL